MTDYTLIKKSSGELQVISKNSTPIIFIPQDPANMDYQQYLEDVENGATVDEQVIPEPDQSVSIEDRVAALELREIEKELGL